MKLSEEKKLQIKEMVVEILEIEMDELTETSHFAEDHGADSLRGIEISAALERTFRVKIPQFELAKMYDLGKVYEIVEKYVV